MNGRVRRETFTPVAYLIFTAAVIVTAAVCISLGSVGVPLKDVVRIISGAISGHPAENGTYTSIILTVRLPRILCVALTGASLSLCGASMQGLLKNPLADGSTLGVSSGAALGAVIAIACGITIPQLPFSGTLVMAILFSFGSLILILGLSFRLDHSLSTNTIILVGIIFSMFASSIMTLVIYFSGEKVRNITFWTMGSLASSSYQHVLILCGALVICGTILLLHTRELNAFAVGEDNARSIGVPVRRVRITILITVSVLIGTCVSIGGTIGFVGLVTPHIIRILTGPNHKKLLPASMFGGSVFLMLCDLAARVLISPLELPIGAVTSLIGAVVFVFIFYRNRKKK